MDEYKGKLGIVMSGDGVIQDVVILARDPYPRATAAAVLQMILPDIEEFQRRVLDRLQAGRETTV